MVAGRGFLLQVEGPHGSLKTDLLERAGDRALAEGFLVGRGSAAGAGLRIFGCVLDAIDELAQRAPGLLDVLPEGCRAELEACLSGEAPSTRQRLFVAVREVLVRAAADRGVLLTLDDLELADPDTLALVEHAARVSRNHRLSLVCAHRPGVDLGPGFERLSLEVAAPPGIGERRAPDHRVPTEVRDAIQRVALGGPSFDLLEVRAASGADPQAVGRLLDVALAAGLVESVPGGGYRFAEGEPGRLTSGLPPHRRSEIHQITAKRLEELGAGPERVAGHLLAAGEHAAAVPFGLEAARRAAAAQLHHEVLRWTGALADHAEGPDRFETLSLRADSLAAAGEPTAVQVYRDALSVAPPGAVPGLRARLARAAMLSGDLQAAVDALEGVTPDGGPHDGSILLARGMLAYFMGEIDVAERAADAAREIALTPGAPTRLLDVITLQGMIAHNRGQWFDRLVRELRATRESPELAAAVFDCHLCVAEFLLYGPTPYTEVVALARELRRNAERIGARRAAAFAVCVAGEAELLAGALDAARRDLEEAVAMHRELGAETGTAHSLQRLAEVELAAGNRAEAEELAREALPLARWSPLARHLMQRTYGTLIAAAPDAETALATVDEAKETLDDPSSCIFCQVMVAVPSAIACAESGRLDEARHHLALAELSASQWEGTAWTGAVTEARACLARAEGDVGTADRLFAEAARLFDQARQPLDAARCLEAVGD
ncbi:MAG: ATP-binding protein [Acidimicrobiia bacterium]|nr:ATP-binding protein [Acidimicrobiia bacterium]